MQIGGKLENSRHAGARKRRNAVFLRAGFRLPQFGSMTLGSHAGRPMMACTPRASPR
jgi:hypothetical protein